MFHRKYELLAHIVMFVCLCDQFFGKTSESDFYQDSKRVQNGYICGTFIFYLGGFLSVEGVRLQAFCSLLTFLPYAVM